MEVRRIKLESGASFEIGETRLVASRSLATDYRLQGRYSEYLFVCTGGRRALITDHFHPHPAFGHLLQGRRQIEEAAKSAPTTDY